MIHGIWIESSGNCLRIEKKLLNLYSEQSDIGYDISPREGLTVGDAPILLKPQTQSWETRISRTTRQGYTRR